MSRRARATVVAMVCLAVALSAGACRRAASSAAASSGPSAGAIPAGSSSYSFEIGGLQRTYHVYRPPGLTGPAPLVIFLHGGYGSGSQAEQYYGWDQEAAAHGFLVVYPDGYDRAWNTGGGCCGIPASQDVDDVAFITAVVARVEAGAPVDRHRVFATGISNGGIMAYRLACSTTLFAAVGPDSATELGSCDAPAPLSVIHIHGTADQRIPYGGGTGSGSAHIDGPAVPTVVAGWRRIDGCAAPTQASSDGGVISTSTATCPDGRAVELITVAGAGHQWPGSPDRPVIQKVLGLDTPFPNLDATDVIWAFFAAHP
ncbi:extracellular catalytic domain type 1 short-chain-length polyhydroxyalkanoate depolymerase [Actinospica durhamensis]|nr:PHB depolymerase family esterase [Actinospica durhamensis]